MFRILAVALVALTLSACAEVKVTLPPYTPVTTEEIGGNIAVNDFAYYPKQGVAQNEIRETAVGRIFLTEEVGSYYANALRRELRQSGASLKDSNCTLDGEVNDFAIDSLGFSADYMTDVRYIVKDGKQAALFDNSYRVKFNTTKFVAPQVLFANINKSVSDNIDQLLKDKTFQKVIVDCKK